MTLSDLRVNTMRKRLRIVSTIVMLLPALFVAAVSPGSPPIRPDTLVQLIIFYPGSDVYQLEGHAALRVITPQSDIAVNYGTFDFDRPGFIYRFVKGETDYTASAWSSMPVLMGYAAEGRRITAHDLNLTGPQKERLICLLDSNLRPENRTYRYNYAKDNCSTRPLAIIEAACNDTITLGEPEGEIGGPRSLRSMMALYHRNHAWYQFGLDMVLGSDLDRPLTNRDKSFAPVALDRMLPGAKIGALPLVSHSRVLNDTAPDAAIPGPTPWFLTPLCVFTILFILAIFLTLRDIRHRKVSRWFDCVFYLGLGLAGLLLTFLIFFSVHYATSPNWLYIWLNPCCLIPAVCIWWRLTRGAVYIYQMLNAVLLVIFCVLWPLLPQHFNIAILPIILTDLLRASSFVYIHHANKHKKNLPVPEP